MSCNISKQELMDYLYDEMSDEQQSEFRSHLQQCQACRDELASLKSASNILASWQDEEPAESLNVTAKSSGSRIGPAGWSGIRRFVFGAAAACAALLVLLSLVNFRVSYSGGEFALQMSLLPQQNQSLSADVRSSETSSPVQQAEEIPVTRAEFVQWQKDSYEVMKTMLEESETQQNRHLAAILANFADDIEEQRQQDLRFVGQGLETFQWSNQQDIRRSAQALQQLILASTQPGDLRNK